MGNTFPAPGNRYKHLHTTSNSDAKQEGLPYFLLEQIGPDTNIPEQKSGQDLACFPQTSFKTTTQFFEKR